VPQSVWLSVLGKAKSDLFYIMSGPALGPTQPYSGQGGWGVMLTTPPNAEAKDAWISASPYVFIA
jgi:hypothetical protein